MRIEKLTKNMNYMSVLAVFSSLAVVLLHANSCFWSFSTADYWVMSNRIECIFYFAVPVFLMISGATLLDYNERYDTKTYALKRLNKAVIPFICWSLIGLFFQVLWGQTELQTITPLWLLDGIINTKIISVYWYFIPQFVIYLLIPVVACIPKEKRQKLFLYIIGCGVVLNMIIPLVNKFIGISYNADLEFPLGGYCIYLFIGYYIHTYHIKPLHRGIIYVLGIVGLLMHIEGTLQMSYLAGNLDMTFKGYLNIPGLLYSVSIFVLFKYMDERNNRLMKFFKLVAKPFVGKTLGIYMVHMFLLCWVVNKPELDIPGMWMRLRYGVGVFLGSAVIIWILQKIPVVKRVVPE